MITRQVFDITVQAKVEKDPNQALNIYAGSDNFLQIGEPEVSYNSNNYSIPISILSSI